MAIEHSDIPAGEIHEPKGVDSANAGEAYIATGTGTGIFTRIQGWGQWQDTDITVGSPSQSLAPSTRTQWTCDGGNLTIQKDPSDLTVPMWSTGTNSHIPIAEYDTYQIRISFIAENYAGTTPYLDIELDIGGSIGVVVARDIELRKGGAAQNIVFTFPVFTGATYLANGGKIYLTYNGTGNCDIYKSSILIIRESKNYV